MMVVNKAVAHTWYCDVLGHMTTRYYLHMFDDASYHLFYTLFGWSGAQDEEGKLGWVDVRHLIEYRAEVSAGDVLEVRACVKKIGGKSMTTCYEMTNLARNEIAATLECVCVLFDLQARKAVALTEVIRSAAARHMLDEPDA